MCVVKIVVCCGCLRVDTHIGCVSTPGFEMDMRICPRECSETVDSNPTTPQPCVPTRPRDNRMWVWVAGGGGAALLRWTLAVFALPLESGIWNLTQCGSTRCVSPRRCLVARYLFSIYAECVDVDSKANIGKTQITWVKISFG